ncbi:MAG: hypothetical protein HZC15_03545 [Candidatus Omnitrophica bacterium]|nr:hypothetical protein [Candidatus Omnitrophota bacterium]
MKNFAVFVSGNGSNFEAIAKAVKNGRIKAHLALLICDQPNAFVIKRAQRLRVRIALIKREDFSSKRDFELRIIEILKENKIGLIVLAVILQKEITVKENDTLESLEAKIHKLEHELYPQAINLIINSKIKLKGRKFIIQ